jgi:IS1 family transposase
MVSMNRLTKEKRAQILGMMVEGNSIRAITRMTGASKNTVVKLLVDAGRAFAAYQDQALRGLKSAHVQVDEIWAFVYAKQKNVPEHMKTRGDVGDAWTWTALDADSKLIVSWLVSDRSKEAAKEFMDDVASRLVRRVQLTSDGMTAYPPVVAEAFKGKVDYAQLVKIYGEEGTTIRTSRYSPPPCVGAEPHVVSGDPDPKHISTSFVERQNLTMRMSMRRFTRLTNAFSKKFENHAHSVAIHFMHYNFVRIHQTTRVTPAMAAGVTGKLWDLSDMVRVIEEWEADLALRAVTVSLPTHLG